MFYTNLQREEFNFINQDSANKGKYSPIIYIKAHYVENLCTLNSSVYWFLSWSWEICPIKLHDL